MNININSNFFYFLLVAFTTVVFAVGCTSTSQTGAKTSNKWRIEFSEGANSDGIIMFRVTPIDGQSIDVSASITGGTRENNVASKVRDAFKAQLPDGAYHVEKDDGEDVLIKRRGDTPNFSLELVSNSVKSVRIDIERE
jgi:hypothetical protein